MINEAPKIIRPQVGPQELFLSTPADIAFYGGAAGGGKTYALLLESLRQITVDLVQLYFVEIAIR